MWAKGSSSVSSLPMRGAHDAQIFTNNAATLGHELSHDVSHAPAIQQAPLSQAIEQQPPKRMRSVRDLVWACNPDPKMTFPG
jgi:hypothetical protein